MPGCSSAQASLINSLTPLASKATSVSIAPRLVMSAGDLARMNTRDHQEMRRVHRRLPVDPQDAALLFNALWQQAAGPSTSGSKPARRGAKGRHLSC